MHVPIEVRKSWESVQKYRKSIHNFFVKYAKDEKMCKSWEKECKSWKTVQNFKKCTKVENFI